MAKRLNETLDKAAFDYTEEEFYADIEILDNVDDNNEEKNEETSDKATEIKSKFASGLKTAGKGVAGFASKLGSKIEKQKSDPIDEVKRLKGLLDIGAISQEEFDIKKKDLLNL